MRMFARVAAGRPKLVGNILEDHLAGAGLEASAASQQLAQRAVPENLQRLKLRWHCPRLVRVQKNPSYADPQAGRLPR
jgi:hypothetical protein